MLGHAWPRRHRFLVNDSADPAIDRRLPKPAGRRRRSARQPPLSALSRINSAGPRNRVGQDLATTAGEIAFAFNRQSRAADLGRDVEHVVAAQLVEVGALRR